MATTVAIVGVSGFSGEELARIVAADAALDLVAAYSDRLRGAALPMRPSVTVRPQAEAESADADIVALATPAEVSAALAPKLLSRGARVVDLSGAFRLTDPNAFSEYYRFEHPAQGLLAEAHYALPQFPAAAGQAPPIERARLIANPGCYATAAILALAPLVSRGLIEDAIFVDGKSGVTGAGRKVAEKYLFTEVAENLSLYRVVDHQHVPEIELALHRMSGREIRITFAPHLLPIRRGLITTCYARSRPDAALEGAFREAYGADARIDLGPIEDVSAHSVALTPRARIGIKGDPRSRGVVVACAIDNLLKGAASQAHENIRRMLGLSSVT